MPPGRPSAYTPEIADLICLRLAEGESLLAICEDEDMPAESTVRGWALDDRDGFSAKYARARDLQADRHAEEVVVIADTEPDAQRARVRVDARKWYASKVAPRRYGDSVNLQHTGQDGGPIQTENRMDLSALTPEQLRALASIKLPADA